MKLEDVQKLTNDELRIKVAELCGWKKIESESSLWNNVWELNGKRGCGCPPLYHCDLNAMQEAEEVMSEIQLTNYTMILSGHYKEKGIKWDGPDVLKALRATARQKAEAFVLTMGIK